MYPDGESVLVPVLRTQLLTHLSLYGIRNAQDNRSKERPRQAATWWIHQLRKGKCLYFDLFSWSANNQVPVLELATDVTATFILVQANCLPHCNTCFFFFFPDSRLSLHSTSATTSTTSVSMETRSTWTSSHSLSPIEKPWINSQESWIRRVCHSWNFVKTKTSSRQWKGHWLTMGWNQDYSDWSYRHRSSYAPRTGSLITGWSLHHSKFVGDKLKSFISKTSLGCTRAHLLPNQRKALTHLKISRLCFCYFIHWRDDAVNLHAGIMCSITLFLIKFVTWN